MPAIVVFLSLLGLVPFVAFGLGAVGHIPEIAERMLIALIDYAALILAFAGGVHWGLALLPAAVRPGLRFGAGVLPLIVAWIGLVLAQMLSPWMALAVLIGSIGFAVVSVIAAYAPNAEALIASRAALGFFGAMLMPSTLSLLRHVFVDRQQRRLAIAIWAAGIGKENPNRTEAT